MTLLAIFLPHNKPERTYEPIPTAYFDEYDNFRLGKPLTQTKTKTPLENTIIFSKHFTKIRKRKTIAHTKKNADSVPHEGYLDLFL